MSLRRRALIVVPLVVGFYLIVFGIAGVFAVLAYILLFHYEGGPYEKLAGASASIASVLLILAFPSIVGRRRLGVRLDAGRQPELFERLRKIARAMGQEMPAEVVLTPQMNAWVTPFGRMIGTGKKWVLGVGLPLMQTATISQFEAVLAHEFGHARGGDHRLLVLRHQTRAAVARFNGLLPTALNPFAWYFRMFLRITDQIGQGQEFAADRQAAEVAGSDEFIDIILAHSFGSLITSDYFYRDVRRVAEAGFIPPVVEGLAAKLSNPSIVASMEERLKKDLTLTPSETEPEDHPPLEQRIAAVKHLPRCGNRDQAPALSLLRDLPSLEHELVAFILGRKEAKLKPIAWADIGTAVWIPEWEKDARKGTQWLKGRALQDLFDVATGKLDGSGDYVLGCAFACSLYRAGWTVLSGPGMLSFKKGTAKFHPFKMVDEIVEGVLTREQWKAQVEDLGLDPSMPLFEPEPEDVVAAAPTSVTPGQ